MMGYSILRQIQFFLEKMNLRQNSYRQIEGVRRGKTEGCSDVSLPCLSPLSFTPVFLHCLSSLSRFLVSLLCLSPLSLIPVSFPRLSPLSPTPCLSPFSLLGQRHREERQRREIEKSYGRETRERDRGERQG